MPKTDYNKLRTKILGIIEGLALSDPNYNDLRRLLVYCESVHKHTRKDGSREFSHQLEMIAFALTYHNQLTKPLDIYKAILVHDFIEDYPEHRKELLEMYPSVLMYSDRLAKYKDKECCYNIYFHNLSSCEVCSIVKLIDRVHNLSTSPGVFSKEKLQEYCTETEDYYFDMIRKCKENFPNRSVYENLKFILTTQVNTIQAMNI